jgi:tRNA nucleotidyltransferase/poly(A) polymerase
VSDPSLADIGWLADTPPAVALRRAAASIPVHWVGGTVRDALLGFAPADFDAIVERDGERIARELAGLTGGHLVRLGKREFASYRVVGPALAGATRFDLWDRRGKPLAVDLLRRDFTVNAVALALSDGRVVDALGGMVDLAHRTLRQVSSTSLESDPLRALRLVRFAARFGFEVEPRTLSNARRAAAHLAGVAAERVREEWQQTLALARLGGALPVLAALDILGPAPGAPLAVERLARLETDLGGFESVGARAIPAAASGALRPDRLALARWCVLARSLGRSEFRHRFEGTKWIAPDLGHRVWRLAGAAPPGAEDADRREWLHRLGEDWEALALALGAELAGESDERTRRVEDLHASHERLRGALRPGFFVDGTDLLGLGLEPGQRLGSILAELRRLQARGELLDRRQALERARKLAGVAGLAAPTILAAPGAD